MDKQDSPMNFFNKLTEQLLDGINNCMLAKIETFDHKKMKANVIPLVKYRNKDNSIEERPMLIEVPVSFVKAGPFVIRPPYQSGDIVLLVFADEDIENVLFSGDISEPNSARTHSLDDAIIIGGIMPFMEGLPDEHGKDLIIANKDFSTKVVLKENGDIIIQGNKVFLGNESAIEGIPLGDTLKEWLDSHTHPAPGGVTGNPSSQSPEPSKVVKAI